MCAKPYENLTMLSRVTAKNVAARQRLRSSSTSDLDVPPSRLVTIGDHAFGVAASRVWNALPPNVTAAPSLPVFKRRLKTMLFSRSFT